MGMGWRSFCFIQIVNFSYVSTILWVFEMLKNIDFQGGNPTFWKKTTSKLPTFEWNSVEGCVLELNLVAYQISNKVNIRMISVKLY